MKPFNGDNWVVKSMKQIDDAYDYKIENLSKKTADLKKKMVDYHKPIVLTHASLNFTTPFLAIHVPSIIFSL